LLRELVKLDFKGTKNMNNMGLFLLVLLLASCANTSNRVRHVQGEPKVGEIKHASDVLASDDKAVMEDLLAAEFAWQDGRVNSAARHYASAAAQSTDPRVAERATRVSLVAREWALARGALERWRELDPKAQGIDQVMLSLALIDKRLDESEQYAMRLLNRGDGSGRQMLGQALLAVPEVELVTALLKRLAARKKIPGGADALLMLSQVSQQHKQSGLAIQFADRALSQFPEEVRVVVWRGHLALRLNQPEEARRYLEQAIKQDPKNKEIRLTYAALLNELKMPAQAVKTLSEIDKDDEVMSAYAAYAARSDDQALVQSAYVELLKLPEPRPDTRIELLAQLAELTQQKQKAIDWYKQVPKGERYWNAQLRLSVLFDEQGDYSEAIAMIEQLRAEYVDVVDQSLDTHLAESYLLEAELHRRHDEQARVLDAYQRGIQALPDNRALLYARGLYFAGLGTLVEAEADLRRVIEINPEDADAMNALGYTLVDQTTRISEGFELIQKALNLKPGEPAIQDSLGWAYFRLGKSDEAIVHLRQAFAQLPDAEIASHLGEVLWSSGKTEEALEVWKQGQKKDPKSRVLLETLRRLMPKVKHND
jgi:tetratricopeptide (TPR) repeat protein